MSRRILGSSIASVSHYHGINTQCVPVVVMRSAQRMLLSRQSPCGMLPATAAGVLCARRKTWPLMRAKHGEREAQGLPLGGYKTPGGHRGVGGSSGSKLQVPKEAAAGICGGGGSNIDGPGRAGRTNGHSQRQQGGRRCCDL